jgi:hypothetical protein
MQNKIFQEEEKNLKVLAISNMIDKKNNPNNIQLKLKMGFGITNVTLFN